MRSLVRGCLSFVVALLVVAGCSAGSDEMEAGVGLELTLRAHDRWGGPAKAADLRRAVELLEARLAALGGTGTVAAEAGGSAIVVRVEGPSSARRDRVVALMSSSAELELFDLERNLVSPSLEHGAFPVATDSLYDLLVGRQSGAREDEVQSWYLFDEAHAAVAGPAPTKRLLLPNGSLLDGWRILGVPPGTAVLECGVGEVVCPGVQVENPRTDSYYLVRLDPPDVPELDGDDLEPDGIRQELDPYTGAPIVTMRFTAEGGAEFGRVTRDIANRGARLTRTLGGGETIVQHFAIVFDREIKSWPSIDWQAYPDGIGGEAGVQITGIGNLQEAKDLAAVLEEGVLPLRLTPVSRSALD